MLGFDQQKRHSFYNSSGKRPFQIASDQTPPVFRTAMTIRTDEQMQSRTQRPSTHPFGGWFWSEMERLNRQPSSASQVQPAEQLA
jgi:hypothetical protein